MVGRVNAESCCAVAKENREDERIIDCHDAQHHDCVADSKEGADCLDAHEHPKGESCCTLPTQEYEPIESAIPAGYRQDILYVKEMDCPMESKLIERALASFSEIDSLNFNYLKREVYIVHKGDLAPFLEKIRKLNMTPQRVTDGAEIVSEPEGIYAKSERWRLILSGIAAATSELFEFAGWSSWGSALFAFLAIALVGLSTYRKGWVALKNRTLNINALMSVAVTGALLLGIFPEAAMVIFLFTLSEKIEAHSLTKAQNAVEKLLKLAPDNAQVITEKGIMEMPVEKIKMGDLLRIMPGGRLPLDGIITRGSSSFDESAITGESLPVDKSVDDTVYAGTINQQGEIEYRATSTAKDSTLAKIVKTIESAQVKKAPVQRFIDRFAAIYTPVVFVVALLIALLSPLWGISWFEAIYRALVVLIIACPCALVISTPVAIVSALTQLARHGILVKGGEYIEKGAHLTHIAFDKTGTLTVGTPTFSRVIAFSESGKESDQLEESLEQLAVSLAARSDHPISQAIVAHTSYPIVEIDHFMALPGEGIKGVWQGESLLLGNRKMMLHHQVSLEPIMAQLEAIEGQGSSLTLFAYCGKVRALFIVEDRVKANGSEVLATLKTLDMTPILLSGDHQGAVSHVAAQVGIDQAYGALLPEEKLAKLTRYQQNGQAIAMIGDGINDAPALAQADVSFAMGAMGSDISIETANVALMDDDLAKIPYFIRVSRRTVTLIKQNIAVALGIKALFFIAIFIGYESMWAAVFADVGASLLVIMNSLRILRENFDH
ncbi:heavy metal translocating P-type ATPase [Ignatzschineria cameli]|uniref:P-type Zn(2+) transporter n=1 Tax=Ignatzschineria cameli TaxID=2182793 RepID=A0A2U2ALC3_9GAMM|nr:cation-translocating P-type ATPase [Ignatzschineria cameli]PWD83623.1 heavy metal translocating P-type ATPase [Ignatzschineria cameli]PWD84011.1 heavy metal translocating P-type ATPase [Ignatzschineria cameli]